MQIVCSSVPKQEIFIGTRTITRPELISSGVHISTKMYILPWVQVLRTWCIWYNLSKYPEGRRQAIPQQSPVSCEAHMWLLSPYICLSCWCFVLGPWEANWNCNHMTCTVVTVDNTGMTDENQHNARHILRTFSHQNEVFTSAEQHLRSLQRLWFAAKIFNLKSNLCYDKLLYVYVCGNHLFSNQKQFGERS